MPKSAPRSPYREQTGSAPLSDRVRERVAAAERRVSDIATDETVPVGTLALWQVFDEFGDVRREHRRRTGAPVIPALRDATRAFRRDPSLESLLAVAAFLDEQGLLHNSR
ncbi:MAG TPA: hypothetical protein VJ717_03500 [Gemmatimonadaceae bacterium]|nr:hypothetical protein [Gemmatimonadaceae bacterium]